jgi:hypothetical protein
VRWEVVLNSQEELHTQLEHCILHQGLVVPRRQKVAPETRVQIRLVLPGDAGAIPLTGKVAKVTPNPSCPEAPYKVQVDLLDLDDAKERTLRKVARSENAPPAKLPETPPRKLPKQLPADANSDLARLNAVVETLLQPRELPTASEPVRTRDDAEEVAVISTKQKLPEEVAEPLSDFTVRLVQAITKSSYYTAEHREAEKAKGGLHTAFAELVAERSEITFYARVAGEKRSMLVYGVFDEPTELDQAMLRGTADLYIPKLSNYFESNRLVSISFKRALDPGEFHRFVDLLARPGGVPSDQMVQTFAELRIHNISLVFQEDQLADRRLSWRVEMALTRLRKDLSVIPMYSHLSEEDLQRVRLQVFRDVIRPLRQVELVRELLENCDLVVAEVDEFSQEKLAQMEAQILASVAEESLPALQEGLANDIVAAKKEGSERVGQLLRLTRRVTEQLNREQIEELENAFRTLLKSGVLEEKELPEFVQRKLIIERDTEKFLEIEQSLLGLFDAVRDPEEYCRYLDLFEMLFPELISRTDISAAIRTVERVSAHCTSPAPFDRRAELASAWLEQLVQSTLREEFLDRLSSTDMTTREKLLHLAHCVGDASVPILFETLRACESAPCSQALTAALIEFKDAALGFLSHEMEKSDLPVEYICELLNILARVGNAAAAELASESLSHDHPRVRSAALNTTAELNAPSWESRALDALEDRDRGIQETALKILFKRGSTAMQLFAFCTRTLSGLDDANEDLAGRICSALASYDSGASRTNSIAILLTPFEDIEQRQSSLLSSLRRSLVGEPAHLPVKIAACHALGRLRAREATDILRSLSKVKQPALKQAASHALERIEDEEGARRQGDPADVP